MKQRREISDKYGVNARLYNKGASTGTSLYSMAAFSAGNGQVRAGSANTLTITAAGGKIGLFVISI